jgi:ribosomal-protein-alanine N-acetyltransferase
MSIFKVPVIETERLILRPLTVDDAEDAFEWTGDERVARYMIYNVHPTPEVTREWLRSAAELRNEYLWGFVRRSDGKLIGSGSIRYRTDEERWSFGYNIRYDCWNQGYTTEAALRMMQYVREKHGAKRFVAVHQDGNAASGRVIMKCGLHLVGDCKYNKFDGTPVCGKEYELNEGE